MIPLHKPYVNEQAFDALKSTLESGMLGGDGTVCKSVEAQIRKLFNVNFALLTTSCTHALEMAMMMLDLKPGDEVIVPSFTFTSTANAVIRAGGKPVFCDINERTLTMDAGDVRKRITNKTRCLIPVHYAGVSAEMDELLAVARDHDLIVVEDAAQGVNARYRKKYLGTIGDIGTYSFHETKNYVSGEGGAFITNAERFARLGEIIREKGTNRANFLRGEVDKYTWVGPGSSFVLSELLAAFLKFQLDNLERIQTDRKRIHHRYVAGLQDLEQRGTLRLPFIPSYCDSNHHIFYILLNGEEERNRVMKKLRESGIGAAFHYVPLHSSPYAVRALGTAGLDLPVTDKVYGALLRLPIYPQLSDDEVDVVTETLRQILTSPPSRLR